MYYKIYVDSRLYVRNNNDYSGYTEYTSGSGAIDGDDIKTITEIVIEDKVSLPKDCHDMFSKCRYVTKVTNSTNLDFSNTTNASGMFSLCMDLTSIDTTGWDWSNIKDLSTTFAFCGSLKEIIGIDKLKTSSCTNFRQMFYDCTFLKSLDLSNFDVSHAVNLIGMFGMCGSLKKIIASDWDLEVPGPEYEYSYDGMFNYCSSLPNYSDSEKQDITNAHSCYDGRTPVGYFYAPDFHIMRYNTTLLNNNGHSIEVNNKSIDKVCFKDNTYWEG